MSSTDTSVWHNCSSCKKPLAFGAPYWECSVSTCSKARIALYFCSMSCWDAHLPEARHREAWAIEKRAPSRAAHEAQLSSERAVRDQPIVRQPAAASSAAAPAVVIPTGATPLSDKFDKDVLIVVSKLKKYVKDRSEMNTSEGVIDVLSEHLRLICDEAIANAHRDGRRTVMDRDVRPVTGRWKVVR